MGCVTVRIQPVGTLCDLEQWGLLGSKKTKKNKSMWEEITAADAHSDATITQTH